MGGGGGGGEMCGEFKGEEKGRMVKSGCEGRGWSRSRGQNEVCGREEGRLDNGMEGSLGEVKR